MRIVLKRRFAGVVHKDPGSCYGIQFPDVPGCFSAGDSLDECVKNSKEALSFHLSAMRDDGMKVPKQHKHPCKHAAWFPCAQDCIAILTVDVEIA